MAILDEVMGDGKLKHKIRGELGDIRDHWEAQAEAAYTDLHVDNFERPLQTLNPRYLSYQDKKPLKSKVVLSQAGLAPLTPPEHPLPSRDDASSETPAKTPSAIATPMNDYVLSSIQQIHNSLHADYNVALWRFVDNMAIHVVERHLLGPNCPLRVFSPRYVQELDDEKLQKLAGEDEETKAQREELERKSEMLKQAARRWEEIRLL